MNPFVPEASWIASSVAGGSWSLAPAPYFRRSFNLDQPVASAVLTITALGLYECEINGVRVGDEVFAPGWTDYRKRVQYQTFEIKESLRAGENVIGAILGDGWYCGHIGWWKRQSYGDRPRFLAQIVLRYESGKTVTIATGSEWKTKTGPILESDPIMGEHYDARLELGPWSLPAYDDSSWQTVLLSPPDPVPELSPRLGPPVRAGRDQTGLGPRARQLVSCSRFRPKFYGLGPDQDQFQKRDDRPPPFCGMFESRRKYLHRKSSQGQMHRLLHHQRRGMRLGTALYLSRFSSR